MKIELKEQLAKDLTAALEEVRGELERLRWEEQWLEVTVQQLLAPSPGLASWPPQPATTSNGESGNGQIAAERAQTILAALYEGQATARELHQRTGIPQSTVSTALTRMQQQGMVRKAGVRESKTGISPALWEPTP